VRAEEIVRAETAEFMRALRSLDIGPAVATLMERVRGVALEEFRRQRARLGELTPEQERAAERTLASAVNRISHPLIQRLRRACDSGDAEAVTFGPEDESQVRTCVAGAFADALRPRPLAA
jgi:glutamyl-tRNA reductase